MAAELRTRCSTLSLPPVPLGVLRMRDYEKPSTSNRADFHAKILRVSITDHGASLKTRGNKGMFSSRQNRPLAGV
jgi:hypothetical protein